MKRKTAFTLCLFTVVFGCSLWLSDAVHDALAGISTLQTRLNALSKIIDIISRSYVDEVDSDQLVDDAIRGMLAGLDPHTTYMPPASYEKWNRGFEGYSGIGISFDVVEAEVTVLHVIQGGPAYKCGLQPGDKLVEIDGRITTGMRRDDVPKILMGNPGTAVELMVKREGWSHPRQYKMVRDRVKLESVTETHVFDPAIGYIKIERFAGGTASELARRLREMQALGIHHLVLDLRGNSGGYLSAAVDVADCFLPAGKLILSTKGRNGNSNQEYRATTSGPKTTLPLIVLIDHGSASAAEILAGALQDWDRALIIGATSFGKGLVQSQHRFPDGSALMLTTARYFTPAGRSIQREYHFKSKDEYYQEPYQEDVIVAVANQQVYRTAAGRPVYSGGGITPDVVIDSDDGTLNGEARRLYYAEPRFFHAFAEKYTKRHPKIRNSPDDYIARFRFSDEDFDDFKRMVRKSGFAFTEQDFTKNKEELKFLLKRDLAYYLWGKESRFLVNVQKDEQLQRAFKEFDRAEELLAQSKASKHVRFGK